jgi:hypothetical protein
MQNWRRWRNACVVNPVRPTGVVVLTGDMGANPHANIRRNLEVARVWIGLVLIDG